MAICDFVSPYKTKKYCNTDPHSINILIMCGSYEMSSKSLTPEAAGVVLGTSITVVVPKSTVAGGPYDVEGLNVEGGP